MLALTIETITDLGVPGVLGSLLGATVGAAIAHLSAKSRGAEDYERAVDLIVRTDERRVASDILSAARSMAVRLNLGEVQGQWAALANEWQDRIAAPSRQLRDADLRARAHVGHYVTFLATLADRQYMNYVVLQAALDIETSLELWLRGDPVPPARLPDVDKIKELVWVENRLEIARLSEYLTQNH
jgi:hypothetical protein